MELMPIGKNKLQKTKNIQRNPKSMFEAVKVTKQVALPAQKAKKRLHVVTNTHWDREHRHGFQETRYMLIEAIDKLVDIMQNNKSFKNFVFDGQSVVLEDYLEIKPDRKEILASLIQEGRLHVGPWYTLPDMQSVAPEALIRNLLMGDRYCKQFGKKMNFGYSIFSFGQIAQLPQIYKGFGIEDVIVYKGFSPEVFQKSEFIWQGPDGTEVLASRLGDLFRVNFLFCFTIPVILGGDARKPGWQVSYSDGNRLTHFIDKKFSTQNATELQQDIRIRKENIPQAIADVLKSVDGTLARKTFLAFDGVDFSYPLKEIPDALAIANSMLDDVEIVHSTPVEYFKELRQELDLNSLIHYEGELRFPPMSKIHCECTSTNVEIKQKANQAENTLLRLAEPFSVFNMQQKGTYPYEILQKTWKYLLKTHAHDSIHGIGDAKIKPDSLYRIEQAKELSNSITRRALECIVSEINTDDINKDDTLITIFNPNKFTTSKVIGIQAELPGNTPIEDYTLETIDEQDVLYYEYDQNDTTIASVNGENRPKAVHCKKLDIDLFVETIPAMGYKTYKLKYKKPVHESLKTPFFKPVFPANPIGKNSTTLNNNILRVEVDIDRTLTITDLETGHSTKGIGQLINTGSSGDMLIHREPAQNYVFTSRGQHCKISLVKNSFLSATIRIETILDIPESLTEDRKARSKYTIPTLITTDVTLKRHSRTVGFVTKFENRCRDHKLSVLFPTGINSDHIHSDNAFMVHKRLIEEGQGHNGKIIDKIRTFPMNSFTDVSNGKVGVALFSKGLKEVKAFHDDNQVNCELTLLRSVRQTFAIHEEVFLNSKDEQSQCFGQHEFEYALYFHGDNYISGDVLEESANYQQDLVVAQYGKGRGGSLPKELSFITSSARNVVISGIKRAEDSNNIILRLNNPTDKPAQETLRFYHKIKKAFIADMNESLIEEVALRENAISIKVPPYKIITLYLETETKGC